MPKNFSKFSFFSEILAQIAQNLRRVFLIFLSVDRFSRNSSNIQFHFKINQSMKISILIFVKSIDFPVSKSVFHKK